MSKDKSLYIVQNIFIFMEECFVKEPTGIDYFTINKLYARDKKTLEELKSLIERLYPDMTYIDFDNAFDEEWDNVYISSYFVDLGRLDELSYDEMILVEDGLFDYIQEDRKEYDLYKEKKLYLFKPQLAGKLAKQADIHPFEINSEIKKKFYSIFSSRMANLQDVDKTVPVLFTTPLEEDFGANEQDYNRLIWYLEKIYAGKTVVLKKHPRDYFTYKSDKINFVECNKNVPGQLVDSMFSGKKIYLFPSTISFMSDNNCEIEYLNVLPLNKAYCKSFESVASSEILNDKKITIQYLNSSSKRVIRVFVSSTFNDYKIEREILTDKIFPKISEYCESKGFVFQPVDLRCGIAAEAGKANLTMDICLGEVKRCQNTGYNLNFMLLMGERYGWQPNPVYIEKEDFELIYQNCPEEMSEQKALLDKWYYLDENCKPASYVLRNVDDFEAGSDEYENYTDLSNKRNDLLMELFHYVVDNNILQSEAKNSKYFLSATGQEIWNGILNVYNQNKIDNILCVFRKLNTDTCSDETLNTYCENNYAKEVSELRSRIENHLTNDKNQRTDIEPIYYINYDEQKKEEYKKAFESQIYDAMYKLVNNSMNQFYSTTYTEQFLHREFMLDRTRIYEGQSEIIQKVISYINNDKLTKPFAIYGPRGVGKSSLMAKIIKTYTEQAGTSESDVIYRFIGTTVSSSIGLDFINSVLEQLYTVVLGRESFTPSISFSDAVNRFKVALQQVPDGRRICIFVDAIDQLVLFGDDTNNAWIPDELPSNIRIIYSQLIEYREDDNNSDNEYTCYVKNLDLTYDEFHSVLSQMLDVYDRSLAESQYEYIYKMYKCVGRPIYIRILCNILRKWKSNPDIEYDYKALGYADETAISGMNEFEHIYTVTKKYLDYLRSETLHGKALVDYALGFILAGENGVTEKEMLRLLADNEQVIEDYKKIFSMSEAWHAGEDVPFMVWSRLYFNIAQFLKFVDSNGTEIMDFYHLIMREVIEKDLGVDIIEQCHREIIRYFENREIQPIYYVDKDSREPNRRMINELPYQYMRDVDTYKGKLKELVSNPEYVNAKLDCGLLKNLIDEAFMVYENMPSGEDTDRMIRSLFNEIVSFDINNACYGSMLEDVHNFIVFKRNNAFHEEFFNCINNEDLVMHIIKESNTNDEEAAFWYDFVSMQCRLKLSNSARRAGRTEEAISIMKSVMKRFSSMDEFVEKKNDNLLTKSYNAEKSRFYYDVSYIRYLCNYDGMIDAMDKSIEYAEAAGKTVSKHISSCVLHQIKFYTNADAASGCIKQVDELIAYVEKALYDFLGRRSVDESASRWIRNTYGYLLFAYYFKYEYDESLDEEGKAYIIKKEQNYFEKYIDDPWVKANYNMKDVANQHYYVDMIEGNYRKAWDEIKDAIDDNKNGEKWNVDFYIINYWKAIKTLIGLYKTTGDEQWKDKAMDCYNDVLANSEPRMGNMYFRELIEKEIEPLGTGKVAF